MPQFLKIKILKLFSNQNDDGRPLLQLLKTSLIGPNAFDEGNGERVELVGLVSLVDDGQGNPEPEVLEVSDFFG